MGDEAVALEEGGDGLVFVRADGDAERVGKRRSLETLDFRRHRSGKEIGAAFAREDFEDLGDDGAEVCLKFRRSGPLLSGGRCRKRRIPRSRRRSASSITKCLIDRREKPFVFSRWSGKGQYLEMYTTQGFFTEQAARGGTVGY